MPNPTTPRTNSTRGALVGVAAAAVAALFAFGLPTAGQSGPASNAGEPASGATATSPASGQVVAPATREAGLAAAAQEVPAPPPEVVTRVYDIRDLIVDIPNFTDSPDLLVDDVDGPYSPFEDRSRVWGEGSGLFFARPSRTREWEVGKTKEQLVEDIIRLIQETVAPETWRETGGMFGAIKELSGQLIVTQTAENHRALTDLLEQLREVQNINVRVRAHWVLVADRTDLEMVLKPAAVTGRKSLTFDGAASRPSTGPSVRKGGGPAGDATVRPTPLLTASVADLTALPAALAHYDAEVLCVNGQRVNVGSVRNRSGAAGTAMAVTPTSARAVAATPPMLSGLLLDVRQTLSADRSTALLLVRAQWKEARLDPAAGGKATFRTSAATRPASGPAGGESSATAEGTVPVDRRDGRTHDIRTAARVPVGQMVLIGGATLDPALPTAGDGGKSPPRLYLFVEVTAD
jgi:hypothetical protein